MKVYQAINEVQKSLAEIGIAKDKRNTQGSGYNFRGIDDVYNAVSPLLSKHGLVIIPRCVSREQVERISKSGGALFYTTLCVEFDFVSAEDGSKHTACAYGEAMDSGDKSTNKAMSAAFKYAMFQTFCIPTEAQDADNETHEVKPITESLITEKQCADLKDLIDTRDVDYKKFLEAYKITVLSDLKAVHLPGAINAVSKKPLLEKAVA